MHNYSEKVSINVFHLKWSKYKKQQKKNQQLNFVYEAEVSTMYG